MLRRDIIADTRNSLTSDALRGDAGRRYRRHVEALEQFRFWSPAAHEGHRLWEHQVAAVCLAAAYLASDPRLPEGAGRREAALVKMPTGTGKSGVIAVLSRCLPSIRRVLVITPREALVYQLIEDLKKRFWSRLDFVPDGRALTGRALPAVGTAIEAAMVRRLLPSRAKALIGAEPAEDRVVLVGTFAALHALHGDSQQGTRAASALLDSIRRYFHLVIVDEGHYEPAPDWGRDIRSLELPTVLFSATPYRNDYKSFSVRGAFVFNYGLSAAQEARIVRRVQFVEPPASRAEAADIDRFLDALEHLVRGPLASVNLDNVIPKVIVRAEDLGVLQNLQTEITARFGEPALLIHHGIERPDRASWRFHSVRQAMAADGSTSIRFWLHDTKLMEGVDDPSFVAIALHKPFGNARQLVQQIGRVLRSTDPRRLAEQTAFVTADLSCFDAMAGMWKRYLAFESYCEGRPERMVQNEARLPDRLLAQLPEAQYVQGDFRRRFMLEGAPKATDLAVPATAAVFEDIGAPLNPEELAAEVYEALMAEDRFEIRRVSDAPAGCLIFTYYAWRTSPHLRTSFFPEWSLGVFVLVRAGRLTFVHDTAGIVLDAPKVRLRRVDMHRLRRAFPADRPNAPARVTQMSFVSLDTSERAIRSQAARAHSLQNTFTDLSDPVLVPTSVTGFIGRRARYLGLTRARISESRDAPLPLPAYKAWATELAAVLENPAAVPTAVFDRYAELVDPPNPEEAAARSILLDFTDTLAEFASPYGQGDTNAGGGDIDPGDLCADVVGGLFAITVAGERFELEVDYDPRTRRYQLKGERLDQRYKAITGDGGTRALSLTGRLNADQSFRIITGAPHVVYAHGFFFRPRLCFRNTAGESPILGNVFAVPALADTLTEKGETIFNDQATWQRQSVFGLISAITGTATPSRAQLESWGRLSEELGRFEVVVCDDGESEIADFVAVDRTAKRVVLIHAKASRDGAPTRVAELQVVGRQALASLAFCSSVSNTPKIAAGKWSRDLSIKQLQMSRSMKVPDDLRSCPLEPVVADALADRSWSREIWIVLGRILDREAVEDGLNREQPSNRFQQLGFYIESIRTACGRANAQLKIFCPPRLAAGAAEARAA